MKKSKKKKKQLVKVQFAPRYAVKSWKTTYVVLEDGFAFDERPTLAAAENQAYRLNLRDLGYRYIAFAAEVEREAMLTL